MNLRTVIKFTLVMLSALLLWGYMMQIVGVAVTFVVLWSASSYIASVHRKRKGKSNERKNEH